MEESFNGLSNAEAERLAILGEECAEVIQIVGKILRHGYGNYSPKDKTKTNNRTLLQKELGDLEAIVVVMNAFGDLDLNEIETAADEKTERMDKYLHHFKLSELLGENEKAPD